MDDVTMTTQGQMAAMNMPVFMPMPNMMMPGGAMPGGGMPGMMPGAPMPGGAMPGMMQGGAMQGMMPGGMPSMQVRYCGQQTGEDIAFVTVVMTMHAHTRSLLLSLL
jgi:hypothetical protein